MKTITFLIILASFLAPIQEPVPAELHYYKSFLCAGDQLYFGNKSLRFKKVISDSRCPKGRGVTCIWAGEVKVLAEFFENGKYIGEKVLSGSNISLAEIYNSEDLSIGEISVLPYPKVGVKIEPDEYILGITVSEKTEQ